MGMRAGCTILLLAAHCVVHISAQQQTPDYNAPGRPLSATPDMLKNDPTGRAHLLAALGNPAGYFGNYPYPWPLGEFAIDPKIDPAVVTPIAGNQSPENGSYEVVGNSGMIGVHAIPFPNGEVLFYGRPAEPEGGGDPAGPGPGANYLRVENDTWTEIAAIYDTATNTYEPFHIPEAPFCGAQTILPDGRAILVGGELINLWYPYLQYGGVAVRIYDPETHTIVTVANLDRCRWYPSVVTLPDGNTLIVGGSQQEEGGWSATNNPTSKLGAYEKQTITTGCVPNGGSGDAYWDNPSYTIYDVASNTLSPSLALTILLEAYPINLYPKLWILPSGATLIIAGVKVQAMYMSPDGATQDEAVGILPDLKYPIGANQYTPATMLELAPPNYDARILVAGGSSDYCANGSSLANDESYLIDASPGANHALVTEQMTYRRVMGDLTLLPDGRLFLCSGAQKGLGGGGGPRYSFMSDPTTVAEIYDPEAPVGQRWKVVGNSQIPRLYHSTAWLTSNATVMITGSETTSERRVQVYTPDYLLNGKPRPVIGSAPAIINYNETFDVTFSGVSSVDKAVLSRPTAVTHTNQFDQRQIVLECENSTTSGTVSCTAPPSANIAIPGTYMLFILSDGVPSVAKYLNVPLAAGTPAAPPTANELIPGYGTVAGIGGVTAPSRGGPEAAQAPQGPTGLGPQESTNAYSRGTSAPTAPEINPGFVSGGGTLGADINAESPEAATGG